MPIYDFQCTICKYQSEVLRKMSEPNTTICPNCQKEAFSKLLSAPSFQLSGSGWYATDFKDNKSKVSTKPEDNAAPKTETPTTASAACAPGCACH